MGKHSNKSNEDYKGLALGIIETRGMTGAIEACDTMTKAANVAVTTTYKVDAGIVTVIVRGDIGAVQAAVSAGAEAARKVGELRGSHVIARPHEGVEKQFS